MNLTKPQKLIYDMEKFAGGAISVICGSMLINGALFTEALRKTAEQTSTAHIFETFINDMNENDQLSYDSNIRIENDFTVQYLKQLGFKWSDIGIDYLRKYVEYFRKIGYWR